MPDETVPNFYCTMVDSRYLPRGLALYRSLERHAGRFTLYALCLDEFAERSMTQLNLPSLRLIPLRELEQADPELLEAKRNRSIWEYVMTCKPAFALHVLRQLPKFHLLTAVDADMFYFSSPRWVFDESKEYSVVICDQRFSSDPQKNTEKYGLYNAGLLSFRTDGNALKCLGWWRERCLEWCYRRVEPGRHADQKYLDEWPSRFNGVRVLNEPSVNLAVWNLDSAQILRQADAVTVNSRPLVCYHFHGISVINQYAYGTFLWKCRNGKSSVVRHDIYHPYLRELQYWIKVLGPETQIRMGLRKYQGQLPQMPGAGRIMIVVGPFVADVRLTWLFRAGRFVKPLFRFIRRPSY